MTELKASFYDGKTSHRSEVTIQLLPTGQLSIKGLGKELTYPLSALRISPRVGNIPRSIYLPDGAKCETLDNDAVDAFLRRRGKDGWQAFLHKLESRLVYVFVALVVTVAVVWGLVQYGVPALAKRTAYALPASVDAVLGRESLAVLDHTLFTPSQLSNERQQELHALFGDIAQGLSDEHNFRLEFRRGDRVGPNAFALPSGIIVLTDELVQLAEHQNELVAVLVHEFGHVVHRHALRRLLQNSAVVLIIVSITGDVASLTSLSAALPTMLAEAKYSRDFEREADQFALRYLREHNIRLGYFADILLRLERDRPSGSGVHDYLASHPATTERVKLFQDSE